MGAPNDDLITANAPQPQGPTDGSGLTPDQHAALAAAIVGAPAPPMSGALQNLLSPLYPPPPPAGLSPQDDANLRALLGGGAGGAQPMGDTLQTLPGPIPALAGVDPATLDPTNGLTNGLGLSAEHQANLSALFGRGPSLAPALNAPLLADAVSPGPPSGQGGPIRSPAPSPVPAADPHLGDLSMFYETGMRPGQEAAAAAKVSSGKRDPGGPSYGAYQLNSSPAKGAVVKKFLAGAGAPWAGQFGNQDPTVPNGPFAQTWKSVAAQDPQAFFDAQQQFIQQTHYDPVVRKVMNATGLDINSRPEAVRQVVWSMAVQHGAAPHLVAEAVADVNKSLFPSDPGYDAALINKLYDVRQGYVEGPKVTMPPSERSALMSRYRSERASALAILGP